MSENFVGKLQEYCQNNHVDLPSYHQQPVGSKWMVTVTFTYVDKYTKEHSTIALDSVAFDQKKQAKNHAAALAWHCIAEKHALHKPLKCKGAEVIVDGDHVSINNLPALECVKVPIHLFIREDQAERVRREYSSRNVTVHSVKGCATDIVDAKIMQYITLKCVATEGRYTFIIVSNDSIFVAVALVTHAKWPHVDVHTCGSNGELDALLQAAINA